MNRERIADVFSVMNNAYSCYTFQYFLDSAEALGLTRIDLWGGVQHFDPYCAETRCAALKRQLTERGMSVVAYTPEILAYPYNIAAEDREVLGLISITTIRPETGSWANCTLVPPITWIASTMR